MRFTIQFCFFLFLFSAVSMYSYAQLDLKKYSYHRSYKEGYTIVTKSTEGGKERWGIVDVNGKEIIPLIYDYVSYFSEGLAYVRLNAKYGYVDRTGKEVIPLVYKSAGIFNEG